MKPIKIFVSYSHDDFRYMEAIRKSLAGKVQNGEIELWTDEKIIAGEDFDQNIETALESADIILFLVSMNFIASWYIANVELKKAVDRHNKGLVKLIPVLLEDCDFKSLSISSKEPLPMHNKRLKPINLWTPRSAGYQAVVEGLEGAMAAIKANTPAPVQTPAAPPASPVAAAPSSSSPTAGPAPAVDPKKIQQLRNNFYVNNEFEKIIRVFKEIEPTLRADHSPLNQSLTTLIREWNELKFKEINGDTDVAFAKKDYSRRMLACISELEKEFPA